MQLYAQRDRMRRRKMSRWAKIRRRPSFVPAVAPGEHEGLLASLFRIVPTDPRIR